MNHDQVLVPLVALLRAHSQIALTYPTILYRLTPMPFLTYLCLRQGTHTHSTNLDHSAKQFPWQQPPSFHISETGYAWLAYISCHIMPYVFHLPPKPGGEDSPWFSSHQTRAPGRSTAAQPKTVFCCSICSVEFGFGRSTTVVLSWNGRADISYLNQLGMKLGDVGWSGDLPC